MSEFSIDFANILTPIGVGASMPSSATASDRRFDSHLQQAGQSPSKSRSKDRRDQPGTSDDSIRAPENSAPDSASRRESASAENARNERPSNGGRGDQRQESVDESAEAKDEPVEKTDAEELAEAQAMAANQAAAEKKVQAKSRKQKDEPIEAVEGLRAAKKKGKTAPSGKGEEKPAAETRSAQAKAAEAMAAKTAELTPEETVGDEGGDAATEETAADKTKNVSAASSADPAEQALETVAAAAAGEQQTGKPAMQTEIGVASQESAGPIEATSNSRSEGATGGKRTRASKAASADVATEAAALQKTTASQTRSAVAQLAEAMQPAESEESKKSDHDAASAVNAAEAKLEKTQQEPRSAGAPNLLAAHRDKPAGEAKGAEGLSEIDRVRFVQRVAKAFHSLDEEGGEIRLRLSPPELGSLRLELSLKEGAMTAHLETETAAARNVLLDNLPQLRDRLAEQNIKVERFDVDVRDQNQPSGGENQSNQSGFSDHADRQRGRGYQDGRNVTRAAPAERKVATKPSQGELNVVI